ncbi:lyase [Ascochyta rabiei]|uniref:Lyase n=1 Tax=Didymella rabiei TaxID=5454 RepID=A0A162YDH2_DIDRA|nr:lyase [Ascochyta rabiei]
MAPQELKGILVALVTPFTDDGTKIHKGRLEAHINRMIEAGVHGLVPGGTTGEFTAMTIEERKQVTELCVKYSAGRIPVVAGAGALSTKDCVELAVHAAKVRAAATVIVPPFYDPVNYEQFRDLCKEVYEESKIPIVYYNIPSASGLILSPSEMASLKDVGVHYLKDTSGNAPALTELLFELDDRITAFNGWDTLTFLRPVRRRIGLIEGDNKKGRELWRKIFPICKFLETYNYPSAIKSGRELRGWETGGLRKPFKLPGQKETDEMSQIISASGVEVQKAEWLSNGA